MGKRLATAALMCALAGWSAAANAGVFTYTAGSSATVVDEGGGTFLYEVGATGDFNMSANRSLIDFYIPYFADMGVSDVTASAGWTYSIEPTNDVFGLGDGAGAIHFHDDGAQYRGSFTFFADYAGTEGPFTSILYDLSTGSPVQIWGDPLIPASPDTLRALSAVPEPTPLAAMLAGLGLLAGAARVRRRAS